MKAIYRMMGVASYASIDEAFSFLVQQQDARRIEIRKSALDKINKLGNNPNVESIKEIMDELNVELSNSYEKENFLMTFINNIKS